MLLSEGFFYSFKRDSLTSRGGGTPYNGSVRGNVVLGTQTCCYLKVFFTPSKRTH